MFLKRQEKTNIDYYAKMLKTIGSLSRLFSESNEPYIQYRIVENLFCKSFKADNLSRTDCSADASKDKQGVGIKTFLEKNGATMQKVAEFNSEHGLFNHLKLEEKAMKIAQLRNERIETTKRIFGLDDMIYHCVTRKISGVLVYESPMDLVRIEKIRKIDDRKNVINFNDGKNEYSFNVTKSTLYKRFATENVLLDLPVKILDNPFEALEKMLEEARGEISFTPIKPEAHIFLPLYSLKSGEKIVPEKSGLNQWNASGRPRDPNEVYIQIPAWIHRAFAGFFPPRDESFTLILPNGSEMSAKLCQENSKALMSNPNSALGQWLLRDVLNLKKRELLAYDKLQEIGLDSVVIYKTDQGKYDIDFTKIGSYEEFVSSQK
ncbi:MAG: NgoFVII family restriction endonuclease [Candidatus Azambacteria bacterium]|nr:NgoFVII family restriction endonuclease [Candidatus Azambacteria bacterium]